MQHRWLRGLIKECNLDFDHFQDVASWTTTVWIMDATPSLQSSESQDVSDDVGRGGDGERIGEKQPKKGGLDIKNRLHLG